MKKSANKVLFLASVKDILEYFKNSTGIEGLPDLSKAIEILKPLNVKFSSDTYLKAIEQWENFKHDNPEQISSINSLTKYDQEKIQRMFFGPFNEEWRDDRGNIDNSDMTISKRLDIPYHIVSRYIAKIEKEHFGNVNKLVNKTEDENKVD